MEEDARNSSDIALELNPQASEVLIFKGGQAISVKRGYALDKLFVLSFSRKYGK